MQVDCGKGGAWLFPFLMQRYALDPTRTAVVGDRLDTDIAMGKQGGLVTILPLTGAAMVACTRACGGACMHALVPGCCAASRAH